VETQDGSTIDIQLRASPDPPLPPRKPPNPVGIAIGDITPLKAEVWSRCLDSHPDRREVEYVIGGLKNGFEIGYQGDRDSFRSSPNLPLSHSSHDEFIEQEMKTEVELGRRVGPFDSPPFPNMVISPIGVITKSLSDKLRLIHHYSWPRNGAKANSAINANILEEDRRVTYGRFDDALTMLWQLKKKQRCEGTCAVAVYLSKIDVKGAYRLLPVRPSDYHLLGMKYKGGYYYDLVTPFGLASSCKIWERVAALLEWIVKDQLDIETVMHYVDDTLLISVGLELAAHQVSAILKLFAQLGVPVSFNKLEGPSTSLQFLGIGIDTVQMTLHIHADRLASIMNTLTEWRSRVTVSIHDLQKLQGLLNFVAKVIRPGRTFMRRLINYQSYLMKRQYKPNHQAKMSSSVLKDINWWFTSIQHYNGKSSIYPINWISSDDLFIATDACVTGYGGVCDKGWLHGLFTQEQHTLAMRKKRDSMPYKELLSLVIAASTWGHQWSKKNIIFHVDCEPVVTIVNKGSSKHETLMDLIRTLSFLAATHEFNYKLVHIKGVVNVAADLLSRDQISEFKQQFGQRYNQYPCTPIQPVQAVW
jgi:hypothetical protein